MKPLFKFQGRNVILVFFDLEQGNRMTEREAGEGENQVLLTVVRSLHYTSGMAEVGLT